MTQHDRQEYAQDESKKRFSDASWDRTQQDTSWRERADASRAELAAEGKMKGEELVRGLRSVTIASAHYHDSVAWYRDFLGCEVLYDVEVKNSDPPMRQASLRTPNGFGVNITMRGREKPVPEDRWVPAVRMTFNIADPERARERIRTMGVREYEPEFQGPYGPVFTVLDPDNNLINLLYPKDEPDF